MVAKVYFVTGKGGTGKSTLSRSLAEKMASEKKRVLLLKINSFALSHEGDNAPQMVMENLWVQKMHQRRSVEEYFTTTLSKLPIPGAFHKIAHKIQEGISHKLLANKFVMRFIDACPGLTPTIFLGKVCFEAKEGGPDFENNPQLRWDAVVVDAPSTGQALQVFESSSVLSKMLSQGHIAKHIHDTLLFAHGDDFEIHLMTLPEEGPLQECIETQEKFKELEKNITKIWINKVVPDAEIQKLKSLQSEDPRIVSIVKTELERIADQVESIKAFEKKLTTMPILKIPEQMEGQKISLEGITL